MAVVRQENASPSECLFLFDTYSRFTLSRALVAHGVILVVASRVLHIYCAL